MMEDLTNQVRAVEVIGAVFVLYLVVKYGVRAGVVAAGRRRRRPTFGASLVPFVPDGPGRFRVTGVDRDTRMDTTWYCTAASSVNARAKGELEGIVVTGVERV